MPANPVIRQIAALLASPSPERQIAAAIVLGELSVPADKTVVDGLVAAAGGSHPAVQRHAVEALGRLGARAALPAIAAHWSSRDEPLRVAAIAAAVAFQDDAVQLARARLAAATDMVERRSLEAVLGRVGGKDAFSALLGALDTTDAEAARMATLAVRERLKDASPRERAGYLAQIEKMLAAKKPPPSSGKIAAALKILGYLEDPAAVPLLLEFARDARADEMVRQQAVIALRFAGASAAPAVTARVAGSLLDVAESAPTALARTALYSLASVAVPPALVRRLGALALGGDPDRARLALDRLAQIQDAEAGIELARVLAKTGDRLLAEATATALGGRPDAARTLARALLGVEDPARIPFLARLLTPRAADLTSGNPAEKKLARELVDAALARAADPGPEAQALLQLGRALDAPAIAAGLRARASRAAAAQVSATARAKGTTKAKAKPTSKSKAGATIKAAGRPEPNGARPAVSDADDPALVILRRLGHSPEATPEDGYALAIAELGAGRRDEAYGIFRQLLDRSFDLPGTLRADRRLAAEARYQIGFRLAEERHAAAEEILGDVAAAGRGKTAQMARAKLRSSGYG